MCTCDIAAADEVLSLTVGSTSITASSSIPPHSTYKKTKIQTKKHRYGLTFSSLLACSIGIRSPFSLHFSFTEDKITLMLDMVKVTVKLLSCIRYNNNTQPRVL